MDITESHKKYLHSYTLSSIGYKSKGVLILLFVSLLLLLFLVNQWSKSSKLQPGEIFSLSVEKLAPITASQNRTTSIAIRLTQSSEDKQYLSKKFYLLNERRHVIGELELNDNEQGEDLYKHDGIFTGLYTFKYEGQYWIKAILQRESKEMASMTDPNPIDVLPFVVTNSGSTMIWPGAKKIPVFTIINTSGRTIHLFVEVTVDQKLQGDHKIAKEVQITPGAETKISVPISLWLPDAPECFEEDYFVDMKATLINPLLPHVSKMLPSQIDVFTPRC